MQGIDNKMVWNVEQSGAQRSFRIMQKRGVIIDSDDFLPVRGTYPEHPLSKEVPKVSTVEELQWKRREANRQKIDLAMTSFEAKKSACTSTERPYIYSDLHVEKPRFTSIKQR